CQANVTAKRTRPKFPRRQRAASTKKGSVAAALHIPPAASWPSGRCRRRLGLGLLLGDGTGILALRLDVAIDELDHRDRRGIAVAKARLEHAGVAAVAVLVAGAEHLEQLLDHGEVAHLRDGLATRVQVAALSERD